MKLMPDINKKKTYVSVRKYFEKDFQRFVLMAGYSMLEVQSPRFSVTPTSHNNSGNGQENKIIGHFEAQEIVKTTIKSINSCPDPSNKILINVYIKQMMNVDVQDLLGYGHAQFNVLKNRAFLNFADAFMNVTDLHVYEDQH
ncbi:ArpU family phage packaging/lysis transcriptional regulator [Companilactobacillus jidongensis]|uniref:ArpU family phage packaging/lysis transcriptional regulator n=1 Tax=Companilactobacillus jidongensis TaxID=2486006 RepID=UPI000F77C846|nr:ArpU family phage packaging/lysis transcriptional regulator [Companilactobacillus jidongensis]